ncbi:MAG: Uma2 family endonuclease [Polyangiaceae bacterium]|nr:Uma2 family endonuclease [Polyangiaceae bacterium]
MAAPAWVIDPDDPRAPPMEVWEALSPVERRRIVNSLPSEFPVSEANPPEGDLHFNAKAGVKYVLGDHFARMGKRVYLACELPVYYPGERMFAPDVMAVVDVETHERQTWVVAEEGKGLDFALEVLVSGNRKKDLEENVERYASLGIPEYFVFDRIRLRLFGYRLPSPGARAYQPILPQGGRFTSRALGLDLRLEGTKLRFYQGLSAVPEANELIASLERMMDDVDARARAAEERAEEETRKREEETRKREEETRKREEETRKREEEARKREGETRKREEAERERDEALAEVARLKALLEKK